MVPLLGIAFVVAIVSTGVFYGLFAGKLKSSAGDIPGEPVVVAARDLQRGAVIEAHDLHVVRVKGSLSGSFSNPDQAVGATLLASLKQNEPLLEDRVVPKDPQPGQSHASVPAGMRAISMRVSDSEGLLGLLRPGARVDVQAIQQRTSGIELRTVLQNVEVLALNPQTQSIPGVVGPVFNVTVLTTGDSADLAALVDSNSHVRMALRNPLDSQTAPRHALPLAAAFQSKGTLSAEASGAKEGAPHAAVDGVRRAPELKLRVQVLDATSAAIEQFGVKQQTGDSIRIGALASVGGAEELLARLTASHEVEVVSSRTLEAALGSSVSYRAGSGYCRLRVEFVPQTGERGLVKLRVSPEISIGNTEGTATNKYQADLPAEGSFLIQGIVPAADSPALAKLFPGRSWSNRALAILVTSESAKPGQSALAQSSRGQ